MKTGILNDTLFNVCDFLNLIISFSICRNVVIYFRQYVFCCYFILFSVSVVPRGMPLREEE